MHQTVLVPLDGSPAGERVLPWAIELARARRHTVTLAQIVHWPPFPSYPEMVDVESADLYAGLLDDLKQAATEYLETVRQRLAGSGVPVKIVVGEGQTSAAILDLADECAAATIAMATHSHSGMHRLLVGSVAEQVLHGATVPVFLVGTAETKPRPATVRRLLVPLDGSPFGATALNLARAVMGPESTLVLVDIAAIVRPVFASDSYGGLDLAALDFADEATELNAEDAKSYLADTAESLRRDGLAVETWTRVGTDWREILAVAHEADVDLVVMATHDRSGPGRWIHGSVANAVARHADVPVLLAGPRTLVEQATGALRVADIIAPTRLRLRESDSLEAGVRMLNRYGVSGVPVLDEAGYLTGLLSSRSVVDWEARTVGQMTREPSPTAASYAAHLAGETVDKVMERSVETVEAGAPLVEAIDRLRHQRNGQLVVTHAGRPVGLLSFADVVRAMTRPLAPVSAQGIGLAASV